MTLKVLNNRNIAYRKVLSIVGILMLVSVLFGGYLNFIAHAAGATFVVTNTADSGAGSLRQAIIDSNSTPSTAASPNNITFDIPVGTPSLQTISLTSELPQITQPVLIDGTTQSGASCGTLVPTDGNGVIQATNTPHNLMVEVSSTTTQDSATFTIGGSAAHSELRGLVMNSHPDNYAILSEAQDANINCNYIGTNASGDTLAPSNGNHPAINVRTAPQALIENNLIASAKGGVLLGGENATLKNNIIGLDKTGSTVLVQNFAQESRGVTALSPNQIISHNVIAGYDNAINGNGADNLRIVGNFLGTKIDGVTSVAGNLQRWGIRGLSNSTGITIGGPAVADRNIITGQTNDVRLEGPQGNNIQLTNNYLGLGKDGTTRLLSAGGGVLIAGASSVSFTDNIIVGSPGFAISYENSCTSINLTGNYIGLTRNGMVIPNGAGVAAGCDANTLTGNVISGNNTHGVVIDRSAVSASIKGNIIGLKGDGVTPAPNGARGITVNTSAQVIIGGSQPNDRNIIAANQQDQIAVTGDYATQRKIQGNHICLDKNGNGVSGGSGAGIKLSSGAGNVLVGGAQPGEGNVISCSKDNSNILQDTATSNPNYYYGNIIGLKPDGETPAWPVGLGGQDFTIDLRGESPTSFGGSAPGQGNIIAANRHKWGFIIIGWESGTYPLEIKGNKYGVTKSGQPAGNSGPIQTAHVGGYTKNLTIGGPNANDGNEIAYTQNPGYGDYGAISYGDGLVIGATDGAIIKNNNIHDNARNGIFVYGDSGGNNVLTHNTIHNNAGVGIGVSRGYDQGPGGLNQQNNLIRQNSIFSNEGQGIDLTSGTSYVGVFDGLTPNDQLDPDTGPNNLQNYPISHYIATSCDGSQQVVSGKFNSTANTTFTIDYYTNPSWQSGQPFQGEQWVSSETVTSDANGDAVYHIPNGLSHPTFTATDPAGNTSEFGEDIAISIQNCQEMPRRNISDSTQQIDLSASWTATIPFSQYTNTNPIWNGSQYIDNIQKSGLDLTVTIGGRPLQLTPPALWETTYTADEYGWNANGTLNEQLPEGDYDVELTLTDPTSGVVLHQTYPGAVHVGQPKISYSTTITNNQTPTLQGVSIDTGDLWSAYIVPSGTAFDSGNPPKERVLRYTKDPNGSSRGTWKIITNKDDYIALITQEYTSQRAYNEANMPKTFASNYLYSFTDVATINTLDDLKNLCSDVSVQQRLQLYLDWGFFGSGYSPITDESSCRTFVQQRYDRIGTTSDASLAYDISNADTTYDFSPFAQGAYDIYLTGDTLSNDRFTQGVPGGLVIDLSQPTADVTISPLRSRSPQLTGTVSDPTARVRVLLSGAWYQAVNRGDGTWFIAAGTIAPLDSGEYDVTIEVTNLAGTTTTTSSKLSASISDTTVDTANNAGDGRLSDTGDDVRLVLLLATIAIASGGVFLIRYTLRRQHQK